MFSKLSPGSRIAFGLTGIASAILTLGLILNLIPDEREAIMNGRIRVCEVLAGDGRAYIQEKDLGRWQAVMQLAVTRDDSLVSAGVRSRKGKMLVEVGEHTANWPENVDSTTGQYIHIPILTSKSGNTLKWGQIEMRYDKPLRSQSQFLDMLYQPLTKLWILFSILSFLAFRWFLSRVLTQLDPDKAVPKRVSRAYDSLAGGVVVLDTNKKIILANSAFTQLVGIDRKDLIGKKLSSIPWRADELPWDIAHETKEHALGSTIHLDSPDGEKVIVVNAAPVIAENDAYRGILLGFEDVTQLEEAKQQLVNSQQQAEAANVAKSEFLANMSHEIRTPMNSILGFADILRRGFDDDPEQKQEYLNIIHSSGQHLLDLINDILDLSKVESGHVELESVEFQPHVVINDVLNVFRVKCEEKGLNLDFAIDGTIPKKIVGDPTRLRQILTNLSGNAIKFTSEGGVRIKAKFNEATNEMRFDVIDTGIGIAQEKIEKVFEPFSQADTSTTRKYGGTGLGLAISRKFARMMGGDLTATSIIGEGTTFTANIITQPAAGTKLITEDEARRLISGRAKAKGNKLSLPDGQILLVEDGASNRKLIELILGRAGCTVTSAENGLIGYEKAMTGKFDVVLMDMQMPVMDGYTATTKLREDGYTKPIVAMTANAMREDEELCRSKGCSHFLPKPVDAEKLVALLSELLSAPAQPAAAVNPVEETRVAAESIAASLETSADEASAIEAPVTEAPVAKTPADLTDKKDLMPVPAAPIAAAAMAATTLAGSDRSDNENHEPTSIAAPAAAVEPALEMPEFSTPELSTAVEEMATLVQDTESAAPAVEELSAPPSILSDQPKPTLEYSPGSFYKDADSTQFDVSDTGTFEEVDLTESQTVTSSTTLEESTEQPLQSIESLLDQSEEEPPEEEQADEPAQKATGRFTDAISTDDETTDPIESLPPIEEFALQSDEETLAQEDTSSDESDELMVTTIDSNDTENDTPASFEETPTQQFDAYLEADAESDEGFATESKSENEFSDENAFDDSMIPESIVLDDEDDDFAPDLNSEQWLAQVERTINSPATVDRNAIADAAKSLVAGASRSAKPQDPEGATDTSFTDDVNLDSEATLNQEEDRPVDSEIDAVPAQSEADATASENTPTISFSELELDEVAFDDEGKTELLDEVSVTLPESTEADDSPTISYTGDETGESSESEFDAATPEHAAVEDCPTIGYTGDETSESEFDSELPELAEIDDYSPTNIEAVEADVENGPAHFESAESDSSENPSVNDFENSTESAEDAIAASDSPEPPANDSDVSRAEEFPRDALTRTMAFDSVMHSIRDEASAGGESFEAFDDDDLPPLGEMATGDDVALERVIDPFSSGTEQSETIAASAEPDAAAQVHDDTDTVPFAEMNLLEDTDEKLKLPEGKLISALPMDDEEFREIVLEFKARAQEQVVELESALATSDWHKLATTAHWLKGSGGTAGFNILTDIGLELEQAAHRGDAKDCRGFIAQANDLVNRISVGEEFDSSDQPISGDAISTDEFAPAASPSREDETRTSDADQLNLGQSAESAFGPGNSFGISDSTQRPSMLETSSQDTPSVFLPEDDSLSEWTAVKGGQAKREVAEKTEPTDSAPRNDDADNAPVVSTLPMDDEDFLEIVQEFEERFRQRLDRMVELADSNEFADLAIEAHWLKGSGGSAGFPMLTSIAADLEGYAKENNPSGVEKTMTLLHDVAGRLHVPETAKAV